MKVRVILAVATGVVYLFAVSTQDLRAAAAAHTSPAEKVHVIGKAELHDAVLSSSSEAAAALKSVQDFLARSELQRQIERMGLEPAAVASRAALLSDSDLLRLNAQVMAADQQIRTAGFPRWAIVLITIGVVLLVLGIILDHYISD